MLTRKKEQNTRDTIDLKFDLELKNEKSRLDKTTGSAYIEAMLCELDTQRGTLTWRRLCLGVNHAANKQLE